MKDILRDEPPKKVLKIKMYSKPKLHENPEKDKRERYSKPKLYENPEKRYEREVLKAQTL